MIQTTDERGRSGAPRWVEVVGRLCIAGMATVAYARLFYGVDFTDEAFYGAVPDWFARGGRPFLDELNPTQSFGLILAPLYWLFHLVTGGESTGIILFNRHLYFGVLVFCAWLAARVGSRHAGANAGRMVAAFVLGFSCYNIPALSYNTMASAGLLCGVLLLISAEKGKGVSAMAVFGANTAFTLAALAYATLLPAAVAGCVAGWFVARESGKTARSAWWLSFGSAGVLAVVLLVWAGRENIENCLRYSATYGYDIKTASARVLGMATWVTIGLAPGFLVAGVFLAGWRLAATNAIRVAALFLAVALAVLAAAPFVMERWSARAGFPYDSMPVWVVLGLVFPLLAWGDRDQWTRTCFRVVAPACLLAAVMASFSGSSGLWAAAVGLFPMAVVSGLLLGRQANDRRLTAKQAGLRVGALTAGGALVCVYLAVAMLRTSYRDSVFQDGQRVEWAAGPYAGIATTAESAEFTRGLAADCAKDFARTGTVFVYDRFPAGYLFSRALPRTFSTWMFWSGNPEADRERLAPFFEPAELAPDVVLRGPETQPWIDSDLERLGYTTYLARDDLGYRFLVRGDFAPVQAELR